MWQQKEAEQINKLNGQKAVKKLWEAIKKMANERLWNGCRISGFGKIII